ncbi:MAG TPA: DUF58 domain-containing protein [Phycisphaerales bacterium]|nr:DUF58 domain-containing protein [Phycisphaerales bacterium]
MSTDLKPANLGRSETAGNGRAVAVPGVPWKVWQGSGPVPNGGARPDAVVAPGTNNPDSPWARVIHRRYHFSPAGAAYVVTTMVMILGAINGQNNLLFWLFGLGVAGLLVSGILSGSPLMGLRLMREVPDVAVVGQPLRVRYTLKSRNWLIPGFALVIEEVASAKSWFGREAVGTWVGRLPRLVGSVAHLKARGTATADVVVHPLRRGEVVLSPVRVSSSFPFGITRKSVTLAESHRVLVRPQPAEVPAELLRTRGGAGVVVGALSPSRTGMEFYSLRDYQPGDAVRAVAWRASARLDRPIVRTFATPPGERLWVVLDCAGAGDEDVERVVSIAAGIATRGVAMGLEVGLVGCDLRVLEPQRSGRRQVDMVLDRLAVFAADQPGGGDEPVWQRSRVLVVHAGAAPSVRVPGAVVAIGAQDPRVRVPDAVLAGLVTPEPAQQGWWGAFMGLLGESPEAPRADVGGGGA